MADKDLCECLWGHELSMRRLLSLLRQSQAYCTDNECFDTVVGQPNETPNSGFTFLVMIMAFIVFMLYMRPRSQTSRVLEGPSKKDDDNNFNGFPPFPPIA